MRLPLAAALVIHLLLAAGYDAATPLFEAPDEPDHFRYAQVVATAGTLPVHRHHSARLDRHALDECGMAHHPPLYYAALAGGLELAGATDLVVSLPLQSADAAPDRRRVWKYGHGFDERWPWSREVVLLRLLRALSVAFGLITLIAIHRLGAIAFPHRLAVADLAVLLVSTTPAWSYAHGVLDNGNLAATLSHLALLAGAAVLARETVRARDALLVSLLAAAAIMTKLTALGLMLPLGFLAGAVIARSTDRVRTVGVLGLGVSALAASTAWFFLRNARLYGDLLGSTAHAEVFHRSRIEEGGVVDWLLRGMPDGLLTSLTRPNLLLDELPGLATGAAVLLAVAGVGALVGAVRERRSASRPGVAMIVFLALAAAGTLVVFLRFNLVFRQAQARYLLPAAGPIALFAAYGLVSWGAGLPRRLRRPAGVALILILTGTAGWLLVGRFVPAVAVLAVPARTPTAIAVGVTGRAAPPGEARVLLDAPADGAILDRAPTFAWRPPRDRADGTYFVRITDARGRVLLDSLAHLGITSTRTDWAVPPAIWSTLPRDVELRWFVRRAPDRRARETTDDQPASAARSLTLHDA